MPTIAACAHLAYHVFYMSRRRSLNLEDIGITLLSRRKLFSIRRFSFLESLVTGEPLLFFSDRGPGKIALLTQLVEHPAPPLSLQADIASAYFAARRLILSAYNTFRADNQDLMLLS
jgi:hypothetical protein